MKYHLNKVMFTTQRSVIEKQGVIIWDALCDYIPQDVWTMRDAAAVLSRQFGYAPRTAMQYARAVINNVRAESGDEVIRRQGHFYHWG